MAGVLVLRTPTPWPSHISDWAMVEASMRRKMSGVAWSHRTILPIEMIFCNRYPSGSYTAVDAWSTPVCVFTWSHGTLGAQVIAKSDHEPVHGLSVEEP